MRVRVPVWVGVVVREAVSDRVVVAVALSVAEGVVVLVAVVVGDALAVAVAVGLQLRVAVPVAGAGRGQQCVGRGGAGCAAARSPGRSLTKPNFCCPAENGPKGSRCAQIHCRNGRKF